MKTNIFKAGALVLALTAAPAALMAQGYTSASLRLLKEQKLWFHTENSAGAALDNLDNYSVVNIGYEREAGNFHRPQQGKNRNSVTVGCEGFLNLGSAYAWGEFNFEQRNINDARFNASITDPYRGMPYFMADTHSSDWRNQYYDMQFRVGTPRYFGGKMAFGIRGVYRASLAAKQLDPRVDTRYFELGLTPALVWCVNSNHNIGADFRYTALKEDSRMNNVNATVPQTYYILYGLGVATRQLGDGYSTDYHGHIVGAGLQYNYRKGMLNVMVTADYGRRVENVDLTPSSPKKEAAVNDHVWDAGIKAHITGSTWSNFINVSGRFSNMDGIQYVNERDNTDSFNGWMELYRSVRSTFKTRSIAADYSLLRNRGTEYAWRVDAGISYLKHDDEYILPHSTMNSENLRMNIGGSYNFKLGKNLRRRLLLSVAGAYNNSLSGEYHYAADGPNPDYPTVTELAAGDQAYLTTDYCSFGASAEYSQQYSEKQKLNFFARASFGYTKASGDIFSHRNNVAVTVGVNF